MSHQKRSRSEDSVTEESETSSGVDMNFDRLTQGTSQDKSAAKASGLKLVNVLGKAIDDLSNKFPDFSPPKTKLEWQQLYENTLFKTQTHTLSYDEHLWLWLHLILKAIEMENTTETLLDCYRSALFMLPIKICGNETTWVALINGLYAHIIAGDVSQAAATFVLETAQKKFKYSFNHAQVYWNAVFRNEKQLMKKLETSSEEQHNNMVDLFKIRFSNPYLGIEEDYNEFARWALDVKLKKEFKIEVQEVFLQHCNSRKMDLMTELVNKLGKQSKLKHHLFFEDCLFTLCNEDCLNFDNMVIICEEMIAEEPESFCFYWILLQTLSLDRFEEPALLRAEKIYDVVVRGHKFGKTSCPGMEQRFLEYAIVIAGKTLDLSTVLELMETTLTNPELTVTNNMSKWFASSCGVIRAVNDLIQRGSLDDRALETYFLRVIKPCDLSFYKKAIIPEELSDKEGYEVLYLELLRLWVTCQKNFSDKPWKNILEDWEQIFVHNKNPIMLVGYLDFVKTYGKPADALTASIFAIGQMAAIEGTEIPLKLSSRRCYLKLLQDHLEILGLAGDRPSNLIVEFSQTLQRKLNEYYSQSPADFNDLVTPRQTLNGFNPYASVMHLDSEKLSQDTIKTDTTSSSDSSIVNKLKSLKVDSDSVSNGESPSVTKIFVSNLDYNATIDDLYNAFRQKGFWPLKVDIKKNQTGQSRGIAHVSFGSQEMADVAVKVCDKFNVNGRMTFVSKFKSGPRQPTIKRPDFNKPTLINISHLPAEFKDPEEMRKKLSCYGHVKTVAVEGRDNMFSAKVEFHMAEDASNAYNQIKTCKLFGEDVKCRMGFVSSTKVQFKEGKPEDERPRKALKVKRSHPKSQDIMEITNDSDSETVSTTDRVEATQDIGPQIPAGLVSETAKPKARPKAFSFVPMQARTDQPRIVKRSHMKARIDVAGPSGLQRPDRVVPVKRTTKMSREGKARERVEDGNEAGVSSQSSSTSPEQVSPEKKIRRVADTSQDSLNAPETRQDPESEPPEAEAGTRTTLTNKDFQDLFRKH